MPYLNLDVNYFEHRKTLRLVSILGPGAAEYPLRLWAYCAKHHAFDGILRGYTASEIEKLLGWPGSRGVLMRALIRTNFVEKCSEPDQDCSDLPRSVQKCSNLFKIHSWESHEGHIKNFQIRAKTAAARRWGKILEPSLGDATSIAKHSLEHAPTNPNQAVPNQTKPSSTTGDEVGSAAPGQTATAEDAELVAELAAVGYQKPDPGVEPERALACEYREIRKIPKRTWAMWDMENLAEFKPKARALIEVCGGLGRAAECLIDKAAEFESKNFKNWTINGVVNNAYQWIADHPAEGTNARSYDRKRLHLPAAEPNGTRDAGGFRSTASAEALLARLRGMPDVSGGNEYKDGPGNSGNAKGGGGVQRDSLETPDAGVPPREPKDDK